MDGGRLLQVGTPEDVFARPRSAAVARFVGAENIFEGEIICQEGQKFVRLGQALLEVDTHLSGWVGFSVRPENILVSSSPPPKNYLKGKILSVYPKGLFFKVIIEVGERLTVYVVARESNSLSLSPGSEVYCFMPPAAINVFPL